MAKDVEADDEGQHVLTDMLDEIERENKGERISLGDLVAEFESRGFGPLLLIPALIVVVPITGGIPGMPTVCGLTMALLAVQVVIGRKHPWLPQFLRGRSIKKSQFHRVARTTKRFTRKVDRVIKLRYVWLFSDLFERIIAGLVVVLALSMPPLELLPFAVIVPAAAIMLIALGFTARDGLLIMLSLLTLVAGVVGLIYWL